MMFRFVMVARLQDLYMAHKHSLYFSMHISLQNCIVERYSAWLVTGKRKLASLLCG